MSQQYYAILTLMMVLNLACGRNITSPDDKPETKLPSAFNYINQAFSPPIDDQDCQSLSLYNQKIHLKDGSFYQTEKYKIQKKIKKLSQVSVTESGLLSPSVIETTVGDTYYRYCDSERLDEGCFSNDLISPWYHSSADSRAFKVCEPSPHFPRYSMESASLKLIFDVDQAFESHRLFLGLNKPLEKIKLKLFPRFVTAKVKKGKDSADAYFSTNNLAYLPTSGSITVFPESSSPNEDTVHLWESNFIINHEVGHHFEEMIRESVLAAPWVNRNQNIGASLFKRSLSESFADLISFYSLRESTSSLQAFGCLYEDRDVSSSKFSDLITPKILSNELIDYASGQAKLLTFTHEQKWQLSQTTYCNTVDLTQIHNIGAIIAYGSNELLSTVFNKDLNSVDARTFDLHALKYRTISETMKSFLKATGSVPPKSFKEGLSIYTLSLFQNIESITRDLEGVEFYKYKESICHKISTLFPASHQPEPCI